jgi:hypothetical protein
MDGSDELQGCTLNVSSYFASSWCEVQACEKRQILIRSSGNVL